MDCLIKVVNAIRRRSSYMEQLCETLFNFPRTRLAAYGTLRPGESNHHLVESIRGVWQPGTIVGTVVERYGYPSFTWDKSGQDIPVQILISDELPNHWQRLDDFEGVHYKRIWMPVQTDRGILICNIYVCSPR